MTELTFSTPHSMSTAIFSMFNRSREHGEIRVMEPVPTQPDYSTIDAPTLARALRVMERCNYVVTGLVLAHRTLAKKAVVDMANVRWFPNMPEYALVMTGYKDVPGPGELPPEAIGDQVLAPAAQAVSTPPIVLSAPSEAPARPTLTAPPSARLLESTEEALGVLAGELGCVRNELIHHNAGWFVPGKATAYASALDAIKGLVASLKAGGTVYAGGTVIAGNLIADGELVESAAAAQQEKAERSMTGKPKAAPVDDRQGGLF